MKHFSYFLNNHWFPIFFGIISGVSYIFFYTYFTFKNNTFLYIGSFLSVISFFSLFYIKNQYSKNYLKIVNDIDQQEFKDYIEGIVKKYSEINTSLKNDFTSFLDKYNVAKELINKRFISSNLFKDRIDNLLIESLNAFVKNIDVLLDMQKASKTTSYKYEVESIELLNKNKEYSQNIDDLIKKLLVEEKDKNIEDSINEEFLRNFAIFERIKRI